MEADRQRDGETMVRADCVRDDCGSEVIHDQTDGVVHQASCALLTKPRSITLSSSNRTACKWPTALLLLSQSGGSYLILREARGQSEVSECVSG